MRVRELLDKKGRSTKTISTRETLKSVFSILAEHKIGALVVCDDAMAVLGIVSERDLVRVIAEDGETVLNRPVEAVMTTTVVTCEENDTVHDVMEKMTAGRFRHMPVVEDGRLSGVLSIGDLVKQRIEDVEREAENIRSYIHSV